MTFVALAPKIRATESSRTGSVSVSWSRNCWPDSFGVTVVIRFQIPHPGFRSGRGGLAVFTRNRPRRNIILHALTSCRPISQENSPFLAFADLTSRSPLTSRPNRHEQKPICGYSSGNKHYAWSTANDRHGVQGFRRKRKGCPSV